MPITEILEGLRKEQKIKRPSCTPCNIAINDVIIRFKDLMDHSATVRDMHRNRMYVTKIDGTLYTIDDIEAKIHTDKCWIEENISRYQKCCKEGKLPEVEKFKC